MNQWISGNAIEFWLDEVLCDMLKSGLDWRNSENWRVNDVLMLINYDIGMSLSVLICLVTSILRFFKCINSSLLAVLSGNWIICILNGNFLKSILKPFVNLLLFLLWTFIIDTSKAHSFNLIVAQE